MERKTSDSPNQTVIQGPHCMADFVTDPDGYAQWDRSQAIQLVDDLIEALNMERVGETRIIEGPGQHISLYQIVPTSHIILHFGSHGVNADFFSCEAFNVGECVDLLTQAFGTDGNIQYCQRNLSLAPGDTTAIPMGNMNTLTGNPKTFTHALINWFEGNEKLLGDVHYATEVLNEAVGYLVEQTDADLPDSDIWLEEVDPIPYSWDQGGFSGGYVNLAKQLTMHSFLGINAAYTDIMGYTFDLEEILEILQQGFSFSYYEVDGIFQRAKMD